MPHFASFRARGAMLAAIALALSACDDHLSTSTSPRDLPNDNQTSLTASETYAITNLSLSSTTIVIDGPLVTYTPTIVSSIRSFSGLTVRATFIQQQVRHQVGNQGIPCSFGHTTCTYTNPIQTPGAVPGPAVFELQLLDAANAVLSTKDVSVTLVARQSIISVNLSSNTLVVDGPLASASVTLQNQGPSLSGVAIQGWLVQSGANTARRATGGVAAQCGSGSGVLPNGICTLSSAVAPTSTSAGTGTLIPGSATFELDLTVNGVVASQTTLPVTIKSGATIASLTLGATTSDTVLLEGASASYTAALQNIGASLSGISIQGWINQGGAQRFAGGTLVGCGGSAGALPNGSCTVASQLAASNNTAGTGTLSTGAATFELRLVDGTGAVLSTATIPIYVIDGPLESPPLPSADRFVGTKTRHTPTP